MGNMKPLLMPTFVNLTYVYRKTIEEPKSIKL